LKFAIIIMTGIWSPPLMKIIPSPPIGGEGQREDAYRIFQFETLPALEETREIIGRIENRLKALQDETEASMLATGHFSRPGIATAVAVTLGPFSALCWCA
jgi:hypothetical protein